MRQHALKYMTRKYLHYEILLHKLLCRNLSDITLTNEGNKHCIDALYHTMGCVHSILTVNSWAPIKTHTTPTKKSVWKQLHHFISAVVISYIGSSWLNARAKHHHMVWNQDTCQFHVCQLVQRFDLALTQWITWKHWVPSVKKVDLFAHVQQQNRQLGHWERLSNIVLWGNWNEKEKKHPEGTEFEKCCFNK